MSANQTPTRYFLFVPPLRFPQLRFPQLTFSQLRVPPLCRARKSTAKLCLFIACLILAACQANLKPDSTSTKTRSSNPELPISHSEEHIYDHFAVNPDCFVSAEEYRYYTANEQADSDLWERIRKGYKLPETDNQRVANERRWYEKHRKFLARVSERSAPYLFHIVEELDRRNMPLELALLPIIESAYDPFAYSHGRAAGMWQIIPGTGKMLGLKQNWWYDGRRDVLASTDAALNYLQALHKQFDGDWLLALAAYNSGAGNVGRALRKNKKEGKPTDYWSLSLPKETQTYVPRLLGLSQLVLEAEKHQLSLYPVANRPVFTAVDVGSQIDLVQAARMAGMDHEDLHQLNPAFNRWATDPQGPHKLLLPLERAEHFEAKLAEIPERKRVTWEHYTIKRGDTLSTIARKHNVEVATLQSINKLKGHSITAGKTLMVPSSGKPKDGADNLEPEERGARKAAQTAKASVGKSIEYTVKAGDTMWNISRRYKVALRNLAKWNDMSPNDAIKPGQKLKIWTENAQSAQAASKLAANSAEAGNNPGIIRKVSYKVRSGDSLAKIAEKFRVSVAEITRWNQIKTPRHLQPGQSLTLYVDVTNSG